MLPDLSELTGIGLALALGLLIGLQRGWVLRGEKPGSRFAGIRTYGLLGLAGGIAGELQARAAGLALALVAAAAVLVVLGYWRATQRNASISGTASLTGLLTMAFGFLAASGEAVLASVATGVTVLVLSMRGPLHHLLRHIEEREMMAIARFALIGLVILPLLPDTPFGPYGAWRPRQLWLVVVLVSGFSFTGYIAAKWLGPSRGVLATSAAGALVSSTAVTAALAGKLRDDPSTATIANAGIALAGGIMFLRVTLLTGALAGFALPELVKLTMPGMVASLAAGAFLLRHGRTGNLHAPEELNLRNPFDVGPALLLMVLTMALTALARWVLASYGDAGLATVLAISGTVDVDSAIITMGNLPPGTLTAQTAALVLILPVTLNTLFKTATALGLAGRRAWPGAAAMLGSLVVTAAALPLVL
ncbi:MAG TPA: DUF4010 domain-containing protein [Novosphingobium sp.]|nr:DUF4010 domain-containing protein [Novosphingobium sp.]